MPGSAAKLADDFPRLAVLFGGVRFHQAGRAPLVPERQCRRLPADSGGHGTGAAKSTICCTAPRSMNTPFYPVLRLFCWHCGSGFAPPTARNKAQDHPVSTWPSAACAWRWWPAAARRWCFFAVLALPISGRAISPKSGCAAAPGRGEAVAFLLPVVLVAVGLMWYNAARFGSPFDFGANYNLTSNDMTRRGFAVGRIAPAVVTFLAGIPGVQTVFPYITATKMQTNYMGLTITSCTTAARSPACRCCGDWPRCRWPAAVWTLAATCAPPCGSH